MYGRTYWGALRATFVITPDGTVAHVEQVLTVLDQM